MKSTHCYSDVLLLPKFSMVESRKDVRTETYICEQLLTTPLISANMDTITENVMAKAMHRLGGVGCLHRFMTIEENIKQMKLSEYSKAWVSVGVGKTELERAEALNPYADVFVLDVAHGAQIAVVEQVKNLRQIIGYEKKIVVGNFATSKSIRDFVHHCGKRMMVDAFKVGIGAGSMCSTRIVAGVGAPSLSSILDCVSTGWDIIADGGVRNSGDFAKALAAGAKAVMVGGVLAGTDETPGEMIEEPITAFAIKSSHVTKKFKRYRGSASNESYVAQGKVAAWRTAEGESTLVPAKGPVEHVVADMLAGLRSSMSYLGAFTLSEYTKNAEFITISAHGVDEGKPHGKV